MIPEFLQHPCPDLVLEILEPKQLDRHNNYYQIEGFYFPHHGDPRLPLKNSLVDGELVLDVDPQTKIARNSLSLPHKAWFNPHRSFR